MGYQQIKGSLKNVGFTLPTVFTEGAKAVDKEKIVENTEYVEEKGAKVVIPAGNTGEYDSLSYRERVAVVETVTNTVSDEVTVIGGAGGSAETVKELENEYRRAGTDALLVMPPSHTFMHEEGLFEYYEDIVQSTELGVVFYVRGEELGLEHVDRLSKHENVVGIKYAVNDLRMVSKAIAQVDGDIVWINGLAEIFEPTFALEGTEGFTTGIGNFVPEIVLSLMEALREEEYRRAKSLRDAVAPYEHLRAEPGENNALPSANNVPAVKYGMELAGLHGGPVRPPLVELSSEDKQRADRYYERVRAEQVVE